MDIILLILGFSAAQAYGSSIKRRSASSMPVWWGTSETGRLALGVFDFLVLVLTIALVVWGFGAIAWWLVIVLFIASGILLAPFVIAKLEPFSVAFSCGILLLVITLAAWL